MTDIAPRSYLARFVMLLPRRATLLAIACRSSQENSTSQSIYNGHEHAVLQLPTAPNEQLDSVGLFESKLNVN